MEKKGISLITLVLVIIVVLAIGIVLGHLITKNFNSGEIAKESSTGTIKSQIEKEIEENTNTENANTENSSSYNYVGIKDFWKNFRSAVLSNNYSEIKKFVKFPLKTRGPMDSDPIIEVNEEDFEKTFRKFLQQNGDYDWIKNHEMPNMLGGTDYDNAGNYIDLVRLENDNWARFSNMIMEKDGNGYWRLTFIYIDLNSEIEENTNTENSSSYNYVGIKDFWKNFRSAVLSNNYSEIEKFVKFPLKTRGPMDSDPIIEVNEEDFEKTFRKFLQQNGDYDWIKNHEMPNMLGGTDYDNAGNYIDLVRLENDNWARYSNMIMEKDGNGYWKLTFIYCFEN